MKRLHLFVCILNFFRPFVSLAQQQTASDLHKSGDAKQQKGDYAGAIVDFSKAIELKPKDAKAT